MTAPSNAQPTTSSSDEFVSPAVIVIGFVGGFVRRDDDRHIEVQIIERLSRENPGIHAVVFENRHTAEANREVLQWLDRDGNGQLSNKEKESARIILLGHSWGGSAVNRLASKLNQNGIPVLLTIQLDSINKGRGDDCVVPPNVAQALNFYQTHGLAHGCQMLRPIDASRTQIIGNFRFDYATQPPECQSYSWIDRHVLKAHNSMDCDPQVWSLVEKQIRVELKDVVRDNPAAGHAGSPPTAASPHD